MGMKTVILITSNPVHRMLYEPGLAKHFEVEYLPLIRGLPSRVDAVVYDLEHLYKSIDLRWLKAADVPVVVLTCERHLPIPKAWNRSILTYPVRMDEILRALEKLGVNSEAVERHEGRGA